MNPAASPVSAFLVNQFENNGGVFPYNTREYLTSVRLDHRISESDQLAFTFRYAHDLEENPDVQSLTGFSAGSSIHTYDANLQAAWFHQFSPRTQNEFRAQYDYDSFNVVPNEPGEIGLQISGFANNLGTNIFLPNFTILRRTEIADNFTMIRGKHTMKFGVSELLRGNHSESHTFMPGTFRIWRASRQSAHARSGLAQLAAVRFVRLAAGLSAELRRSGLSGLHASADGALLAGFVDGGFEFYFEFRRAL